MTLEVIAPDAAPGAAPNPAPVAAPELAAAAPDPVAAIVSEPVQAPVQPEGAPAPVEGDKPGEPALKPHTDKPTVLEALLKPKEEPKPGEKPAEAAPDAAKPGEQQAPAEIVYNFEIPEDIRDRVQPQALENAAGIMRQYGISHETAQALVNEHFQAMRNYDAGTMQRQHDTFDKMRAGWVEDMRTDPIFGGARYDRSQAEAAEMLRRFVPVEDRKLFEEGVRATGFGDHPAIFRFLCRVAQQFKEPAAIVADTNFKPPKDIGARPRGRAATLYDQSQNVPPRR